MSFFYINNEAPRSHLVATYLHLSRGLSKFNTMQRSPLTLLALAACAAAKQCLNQTVPVSLSARQAVFDIAIPQTNLEVTDFILNMTTQGKNFTNIALTGYSTTVGTYDISTQFCWPDSDNSTNPTVQVLTHGIGFDKT